MLEVKKTTYFGEDCIYTHGIYAAEKIAEDLYDRYKTNI